MMLKLNVVWVVMIEGRQHVKKRSKASKTAKGGKHVSNYDSNDTRRLCLIQILVKCGLVDRAAYEEELEDGGHLEEAHDHIEVV